MLIHIDLIQKKVPNYLSWINKNMVSFISVSCNLLDNHGYLKEVAICFSESLEISDTFMAIYVFLCYTRSDEHN